MPQWANNSCQGEKPWRERLSMDADIKIPARNKTWGNFSMLEMRYHPGILCRGGSIFKDETFFYFLRSEEEHLWRIASSLM